MQEPGEIKNKFHITWAGELSTESGEFITSISCIPLITLGKAAPTNCPDWTCISVGFSTGFIGFYTETGALLHKEQLHNESIISIKSQSLSRPKHAGEAALTEELHVFYHSTVCVLPGFPLFSTLRACRNHLARIQANCNDNPPLTNLTFKKFGFKNQDVMNDGQVIGITSVNTFDHLMTASICGGFNANYRSSAPQHNLVMATGKRPYIGFHFALEGGSAPVLSDVAMAMASSLANAIGKIGTAVPWFRSNSKGSAGPEKPKGPVLEQAEAMTCRFGLSDIMREGDSLIISPNKTLSVVTDTMGRVILVDNRRGIALRMWKGYRDAQCGWIEVFEDKIRGLKSNLSKHERPLLRTALFLVIYAPKKGIIDIWSVQQGGKITTFSASKNGRLLYLNYGLMGLNDVLPTFANKPEYGCVFIDPLGGLKEIKVPFHFTLTSKNGKRARDVHLMKKLKTFMREEEFDDEKLIKEVENICSELKTNEVRLQVLEMLMSSRHVISDAILTATNCFIKLLIQFKEEELEVSGKLLYHLSVQLQKAVEFYKFIRIQFDTPPQYNTVVADNILGPKELSEVLLTSERELIRILKQSKSMYQFKPFKPLNKVTFVDDGSLFLDFLSFFDWESQNSLQLLKDLTQDKKYALSSLIYQGWMYSNDSTKDWQEAAKQSNINAGALMELSLIYWLNKRPGAPLEVELIRFTELLQSICSLAQPEDLSVDYNELSCWWIDARNILINSTRPFAALTAALACRSVLIALQTRRDDDCKDDNGNQVEGENQEKSDKSEEILKHKLHCANDWVNISKDTCQFSLLIGNLEDVSILNSVVTQEPFSDETTKFPALPFEKLEISLANIINKGKGSVSEMVARWLASSGVNPARLIDTTDVEFDQTEQSETIGEQMNEAGGAVSLPKEDTEMLLKEPVEIGSEAKTDSTACARILDDLTVLKRHFPYSLTSSVLLANLGWQFVMYWSKDVTKLHVLESALAIIRLIPMKSLRQGVCCLLWTIHVKKRMEAAAKLMNKLGKLPKERLCIQDIGLSDMQTVEFLKLCGVFLDIFLDSEVIEEEKKVKAEELWEGHDNGPEAFAVLANSQTNAWYDLVMLHLQLAYVMHMIAHFSIKTVKPITNLFESVVNIFR